MLFSITYSFHVKLTDSAAFYALTEVSHWAESAQGSVPVPLSTKKRLEGRVWFNYPGQTSVDHLDASL